MPAFPALRMRTKVLLLCVSCTFLALSLQALFFQSSASSILYRRERESSRKSLEGMQDELYMWIKAYENDLIKIYNMTDFIRDLSDEPADASALAGLRSRYRRVAYDMAFTVFDAAQGVSAFYVYDSKDGLVSSYRSAATPRSNYPEDIYQDRSAFNAGVVSAYVRSDKRTMLVSSYFNRSRNREIVRFVLDIYAKDVTRKIGYLICDVDSGSFRRIIAKYVFSEGQLVWLQPSGDRPVFLYGEPEKRQRDYYETATAAIMAGRSPEDSAPSVRDSVFFDIPQEKYDLTAFSLTPNSLLESSQRALARNLLVIALLVVAVAVFGAAAISLSLTRPLTRMARTLKRIRDGEADLRLDSLKADEVGEVGQAVNQMLDQIKALIAEEYDAQLLLRETEFKALQAQVNPHFLYNSLDTMAGLAQSKGCPEVGTLCRALSNVFRYSIDSADSLSTIRDEIVNVKNYMHVMNARMNGAIILDMRVDPTMLDERVPRLCLQPLVENAIVHGLKDKRGERRLSISGELEGELIILSVQDNGVGMDETTIEAALSGGPRAALSGSSSIGLRNIDSRIKLLFGAQFGVSVKSVPGSGCLVSLSMPRRTDGAKAAGS
jgi:sensor histidine kinase YesM